MDQHHVNISMSGISCGVLELSRIESDSEKVLYALASHLYHPSRGQPAAFVIWSDLPKDSNGSKLCRVLEDFFDEALIVSQGAENPKTSNTIVVFCWCINHVALKEWYVKQRVKKAQKL